MKNINNNSKINKYTLSALFLALALILPFLSGQLREVGKVLLLMHYPIYLCGFICGSFLGFIVGLIAPILRSFIFGMPILFPNAIAMSVELAVYGFICGYFYNLLNKHMDTSNNRVFAKAKTENCDNQHTVHLNNRFNRGAHNINRYLCIYLSLIFAMIIGRIVWIMVDFILLGITNSKLTFSYFIFTSFVEGFPGIIIQLIVIPILVIFFNKNHL